MDVRKPGTGGLEAQSGLLLFPRLLTLTLGLALARAAVLPCPDKSLEVTLTRTEPEMSMNETLILSCKGCSRFAHSSFLYWLGNHTFIENLTGKLWEDKTRRLRQSGVTLLQRDLVLEELSPDLQNTQFSCVLVDPVRVVERHMLLAQFWEPDGGTPPTTCGPEEAQPTASRKLDQA